MFPFSTRRVGAACSRWLERHRRRREAAATERALSGLDAGTLRDLGFSRAEIGSVAAERAGIAERSRRLVVTGSTVRTRASTALACTTVAALVACATPTPLPPQLQPGPNETLVMTVSARGVQIYECKAAAWTFIAPEATLFDAHGRTVGQHGAGPFWQANDGSRVVGTVKARAEAPAPGAIPWLLLTARSAGVSGVFDRVSSVQRVNTVGGSAPASPCEAGAAPLRVPYTADYHLYRPQ